MIVYKLQYVYKILSYVPKLSLSFIHYFTFILIHYVIHYRIVYIILCVLSIVGKTVTISECDVTIIVEIFLIHTNLYVNIIIFLFKSHV